MCDPQAIPGDVTLSGHDPRAVLEVIRERSRSGRRDDGCRVALVVEGGAMRGVYSAGLLLALHAQGLAHLFDDVYGTSAGAVNAAHFVSGRGEHKVDTYYRCLADGRFLSPLRLHRVVDIDFFVDEVLAGMRPVETELVLEAPTRLWICVGDYAGASSKLYQAKREGPDLLQLLKASVAMPVVYNERVPIDDLAGFDAGFFNPFPLQEALADGATHVLVLVARSRSHRSEAPAFWQRALFNLLFARSRGELRRLYADSHLRSNRLRDLAHGKDHLDTASSPASIATIAPRLELISRTSQDVELLRSELIRVARGALQLFDHPQTQLDSWIAAGYV